MTLSVRFGDQSRYFSNISYIPCQCDSGYVGRTTQRFEDRIKQHVPSSIRNKSRPQREVLESIYISTKKPLLCRQKEFVFTLVLHW